jgi:nuclear GTP-binding protein
MDIVKPTEKAAKVFDIAAAMALKPTIIEDQDAAEEYEYGSKNLGQNSRRAYLKELRKVVERSDVILQVLDARDPNGTKSSAVEEMVLSNHRKKLVYVLNKCDLVPKDVLIGWLANLRQYHPAVPFKCNTQSQKDHLSSSMGKISKQQESSLKTNHAVGAEELIGLLKNYSRIGDTKSIITVGIVGFPNVGKSSLINSLMRTRAVGVSAMPGFTKVSQEVILDKNIRLIDSPGIVFADGDSAATILRNCVNVEAMEDVITPTQAILDRCPQAYLMQVYSIPTFKENDCVAFLALVAKAMGKLKKGGIPNIDAAARCVLHDWNNGKIKYFCKPPKIVNKNSELEEKELKIITEFSKELDIFDLKDEAIRIIDDIHVSNDGSKSNDNDVSYVQMDFDDV